VAAGGLATTPPNTFSRSRLIRAVARPSRIITAVRRPRGSRILARLRRIPARRTATGVAATEAVAEAAISRWSLRRRKRGAERGAGRVDALIVALGNPGDQYAGTRHNLGFEVASELARRWELPRARKRYGGLIAEGRAGMGGPRVAILMPQTFMNESGSAAGPARGELGIHLDQVIAVHDEIDLPFGEVRSKLGGGVAGHNGLKSLAQGLGDREFWRVRGGVGRPESTDPEVVSSYVLSRFREPSDEVRRLVHDAADETERLVDQIAGVELEPEEPMS
jgi:PTH1 family peptidyl-tRNA hydrolase